MIGAPQEHLVDSGPLVALLNRRDRFHGWTRERLAEIERPLLTCEAVLAEACHLLRRAPGGCAALLALVERGAVRVPLRLESEAAVIGRLLRRYADRPISLADACLVRMSEIFDGARVVTLDADFRIYRRLGRRAIPVLLPPGR